MLICETHKFIFTHMPKNFGTATTEAIQKINKFFII
jgi:hypothetical protein